MIKLIIVWGLALLSVLHSIISTVRSNFNAGHAILWIISSLLLSYAIFHDAIDAFCQAGFGLVLKWLFFAGILAFAGLFVFVAVSGYSAHSTGDEKAIIVLGAGLRGERVSDVLRRRLVAAQLAYEQNPDALLVVTGGQGRGEDIPEAVAMRRWLVERGVPEEKIILEDKSTSTLENLSFSIPLLEEQGISPNEPVALVTNAFHCYRAREYAKKLGYSDMCSIPASMSFISIVPSYGRELLAILYMWVFKRQLA